MPRYGFIRPCPIMAVTLFTSKGLLMFKPGEASCNLIVTILRRTRDESKLQMVVLPGIAFAASCGFSQTPDAVPTSSRSAATSHRVLAHYSRLKSFSKIPKTAAKQTKYISFLTAHLSLLANQQSEAAKIFAAARHLRRRNCKTSMKAARKSLGQSVMNNDTAGISKAAAAIGALVAQRHTIGANANAAFFQLLTEDQQAELRQLTRVKAIQPPTCQIRLHAEAEEDSHAGRRSPKTQR